MGREIRRVPPNWQHPMQRCPHSPWAGGCDESKRNNGQCYIPLYDRSYKEEADEWMKNCALWAEGKHEDQQDRSIAVYPYYWDWAGSPPNEDAYRPEWTEEPTWFQVYETVSEGTPVTPAFATQQELIEYLVEHGDFWNQLRHEGGWERASAEAFVGEGFAPSLIGVVTPEGVTLAGPGHQAGIRA